MDNFYVVSGGSYSDYRISFILKSPNVITEEQFRKYYLESIKRSSEFDDEQCAKLAKYLDNKWITSTNFYDCWAHGDGISAKDWPRICNEAGVEKNPREWLEKILIENGCEIVVYKEFNTDDWD